MSEAAKVLVQKWFDSTLAGNDSSYIGHTENEWEDLESAIAAALAQTALGKGE